MANSYTIYVIANSELFRAGLNAVAAFCNSSAFKSSTYIGAMIGIIMTALVYIKNHDMSIFLKWIVMYFFIFNVLLGVTTSVVIVSTSDNSISGMTVDNIPIGIAFPAHLITAISQQFGSDLEIAFHNVGSSSSDPSLPQSNTLGGPAFQYNRTGMLFGSNLFQLSLATQLQDPGVMYEMNQYIRNCVVGDILINKKYTFDQLEHSDNLWGLMSSNPSPIRGISKDGEFFTCQQVATDLTAKLNDYVSPKSGHKNQGQSALSFLAKFIPSHKPYAEEALQAYLESSYQGIQGRSQTANQILMQNLTINAFRMGIRAYAAETGSTAGLLNFSNTSAMMNTRLAWATSAHMGVQTLPLMQVVLLLMMVCIFPLIAILAVVPGFGHSVLKNYIYTLIWLESWPILYTVLNLAMTFYVAHGAHEAVTLANIDRLSQEHSDIAGIAGYLILAIPFLSIGLVKGMASTFNQAAQYIGGMMHSIGQSASHSVAMGNYSLGNISMHNATANNVSANKHDTNFSNMHGMMSEQMSNGATVTTTASGASVVNTSGAMSHLATGVNASESISASLSKSAERHQAQAESFRQSEDHAFSNASTHAMAFDALSSKGQSLSDSSSTNESAQASQALNNANSVVQEYMDRTGMDRGHAFKAMTQAASHESISIDSSRSGIGTVLKYTIGASGKLSADSTQQSTSSQDRNYQHGSSHSVTDREAADFSKNMNIVSNYAKSHSVSDHQSQSEQLISKVGNDYREAENYAKSRSIELSNSERLSHQANYVRSHGEMTQSNFSQVLSDYVHRVDPANANRILTDTSSYQMMKQRESMAQQVLHNYSSKLEQEVLKQSSSMSPEKTYQQASGKIRNTGEHIQQQYDASTAKVESQSRERMGAYNQERSNDLKNDVGLNQSNIKGSIQQGRAHNAERSQQDSQTDEAQIAAGKADTHRGLFGHLSHDYDKGPKD